MNSPGRTRGRFEFKRRYFTRGYLWPWSLIVLVPILLRFVMFYDISFSFQSSLNRIPEGVRPKELIAIYKRARDSMDGSPALVVRPNEEAWIDHHPEGPMMKIEIETSKGSDPSLAMRPNGRELKDGSILSEVNEVVFNVGGAAESLETSKDIENTEIDISKGNDRSLATSPNGQESKDGDILLPEGQLREVGERIEAVNQFYGRNDNGEEISRLKDDEDQINAEVQERADNDSLQIDTIRQVLDTETTAEEGKAESDRKDAEKYEERMDAANEREADKHERAEEEREVEQDRESGNEQEASQGRNAEEESKIDEQGEKKADEGKEVSEQRKVALDKQPANDWMKADEHGDNGGEKGEDKNSAAANMEADKFEEGQKQSEQVDDERKNFNEEEQKIANDQEEDRVLKSFQSTETSKQTEENNPPEEKEKEEEKHEDSDPKKGENGLSTNDHNERESLPAKECDPFDGDWEFDPEGPLYTNSTCFFIRGDHNCMSNGRPDTAYQSWRWKPRACDLPRFDAKAFMEAFRGRSIGYVGDSLARNQMQSMLCLLSLVEIPILVHEDELTARWVYQQHKVTLAAVWSPYLLKESREGVLGFEKGQSVVYLDVLDPIWTLALPHLDIIVLSVGQWYFKPSVYAVRNEIIGCHYCPNLNLTEMGIYEAYSTGLRLALEKVSGGDWNGTTILSSFALSHDERGPGEEQLCRRERPLEQEEFENLFRGMSNEMRDIGWGELNRMVVNDESKLKSNDLHMDFLDVAKLSSLRADGHPGPYYLANPSEQVVPDCLHWCLPGPIDTWNELLVKLLHKYA